MSRTRRRSVAALACAMFVLSAAAIVTGPASVADPVPDNELIRPLPVITPTPSNWVPKFPFPYDATRDRVTDADITAEREMCQWYNAQYELLIEQIDRVQFNRIQQDGPGIRVGSGTDWDYTYGMVQQQVDVITANIDQSEEFLAPRAQALTQIQDFAGDNSFALYQGESFYLLWQHLSNVSAGIKAHQPDWFTGPSLHRAKLWGSRINRSHVCR
jgi:hypothetical protein